MVTTMDVQDVAAVLLSERRRRTCKMKRLGIFITKAENKELRKLLKIAQETPVIAFSSAHALNEGGLSGQAWTRVKERTHAIALSKGLPEIRGFYGCDLESGEIVSEG
jgi:hypothetical protein